MQLYLNVTAIKHVSLMFEFSHFFSYKSVDKNDSSSCDADSAEDILKHCVYSV